MLIALFVFLILQNNIFDSLVDLYFNFKIIIFLKKKTRSLLGNLSTLVIIIF